MRRYVLIFTYFIICSCAHQEGENLYKDPLVDILTQKSQTFLADKMHYKNKSAERLLVDSKSGIIFNLTEKTCILFIPKYGVLGNKKVFCFDNNKGDVVDYYIKDGA